MPNKDKVTEGPFAYCQNRLGTFFWVVSDPDEGEGFPVARCPREGDAKRIVKALHLLEEMEKMEAVMKEDR